MSSTSGSGGEDYPNWVPRQLRNPWILGVLVVLLAIPLIWLGVKGGDTKSPGSDATASATGSALIQPSTDPSSSPTATPSSTPIPSQLDPKKYTGGDAEHADDGRTAPAPGFTATSDRKPQATDAEAAKKAMGSVLPLWGSNDFADGMSMDTWGASFRTAPGSSVKLYNQSRQTFNLLWNGAFTSGYAVKDATLVSSKELWNAGSHSLWRVTIKRNLVPLLNTGAPASSEELTWDFLIKQDDPSGVVVVAYADPLPANLSQKTFYLPTEYR